MIFISLFFLLFPIFCQFFVGRKLIRKPKFIFFTFSLIMILIQAYLVSYVPRISGYRFEEFINRVQVTELRSNPIPFIFYVFSLFVLACTITVVWLQTEKIIKIK